ANLTEMLLIGRAASALGATPQALPYYLGGGFGVGVGADSYHRKRSQINAQGVKPSVWEALAYSLMQGGAEAGIAMTFSKMGAHGLEGLMSRGLLKGAAKTQFRKLLAASRKLKDGTPINSFFNPRAIQGAFAAIGTNLPPELLEESATTYAQLMTDVIFSMDFHAMDSDQFEEAMKDTAIQTTVLIGMAEGGRYAGQQGYDYVEKYMDAKKFARLKEKYSDQLGLDRTVEDDPNIDLAEEMAYSEMMSGQLTEHQQNLLVEKSKPGQFAAFAEGVESEEQAKEIYYRLESRNRLGAEEFWKAYQEGKKKPTEREGKESKAAAEEAVKVMEVLGEEADDERKKQE
ncbi:uncharacterized protein METZ01_LOCUS325117, partial [marine metagenome]